MSKKVMRLFHGTSMENVEAIKKEGLKVFWEGVYLTDSIESAQRWMGFRMQAMGKNQLAVIEIEVDDKHLVEGTDHSPMMVAIFGVGKSILSLKGIPKSKIKDIHYFQIGK